MNRDFSFGELILSRQFDAFNQTVVALVASLLIKKQGQADASTFGPGLADRVLTSSVEWTNRNQVAAALRELEPMTALNGHTARIAEIITAVSEYMQSHDDCFDAILNEHNGYSSDTSLYNHNAYVTKQLMTQLDCFEGLRVYNPFAGTASIASTASGSYIGTEVDKTNWAVGVLRLESLGIDSTHYTCGDPLAHLSENKQAFDVVFSELLYTTPPSIADSGYTSVEDYLLRQSLASLADDGRLYLVLDQGIMSEWHDFNAYLVDNQLLRGVSLLYKDDACAAHRTLLLIQVSKTASTAPVIFESHLSQEFYASLGHHGNDSVEVAPEMIQDKAYDLSPNLYALQAIYSELQEQGQSISPMRELLTAAPSVPLSMSDQEGHVFSLDNFGDFPFKVTLDSSDLTISEVTPEMSKYVTPFVVLYCIGEAIHVAQIHATEAHPAYVPCTIVLGSANCYSLPEAISVEYLASYFASTQFLSQVESLALSKFNVARLVDILYMDVPSAEAQSAHVETLVRDALQQLKQEKEAAAVESEAEKALSHEQFLNELRMRKHAMGQEMLQIRSKLKRLFHVLDKQGLVSPDTLLNAKTKTTYGDYRDTITQHTQELSMMIETMSSDSTYGETTEVNIYDFFNQWIESHKAESNFKWELVKHEDLDESSDCYMPTGVVYEHGKVHDTYAVAPNSASPVRHAPGVMIPEKALKQIMMNIADNASKYAFTSADRDDYTLRIEVFNQDELKIRITNNGKPLSASVDASLLLEYGYGNGTGIGLWQIRSIMDEYGQSLSLVDERKEEFPFGFELEFTNTTGVVSLL